MTLAPQGVPHNDVIWMIFIFILIIYSIVAFIDILFLLRHRRHWYLRARSLPLLLAVQFSYFLANIAICIQVIIGTDIFPCWGITFLSAILVPAAYGIHVIRTVKLILIFSFNRNKIAIAQQRKITDELIESNEQTEETKKKLEKRTHLLSRLASDRSTLLLYLGMLLFHLLIYIICLASISGFRNNGKCEPLVIESFTASIIILNVVTEAALLVFTIGKVRDEFSIAKSIYTSVGVWIVAAILYAGTAAIPGYTEQVAWKYWSYSFWLNLGLFGDTFLCIQLPLIQCIFLKSKSNQLVSGTPSDNPNLVADLHACLNDTEMGRLFEKFCSLEFSSENYFFYRQYMKLFSGYHRTTLKTKQKKRKELTNIVDLFLRDEAPLELNVSGSARTRALENFERLGYEKDDNLKSDSQSSAVPPSTSPALSPSPSTNTLSTTTSMTDEGSTASQDIREIFEEVEQEILSNLLDTFTRFKFSNSYQSFMEQRQIQNKILMDAGLN
eukprot:gb/GECH01005879.1/.p1 GENE.gb/GECH01005879.1/~~gb/GECH01005879.1/.p1  ORF type:complete len:499 (+),score=109.22 gb/GECH01005879.1/:1-1497(+)